MIHEAARIRLKLNGKICKTSPLFLPHIFHSLVVNYDLIFIPGELCPKCLIFLLVFKMEDMSEFIYLCAMVDKEGGGDQDIKNRLQKARGAFYRLTRIWNTTSIGRNTNIHLFKTLVRNVLLYRSETWKITLKDEKQLDTFQTKFLRRIMKIRWQQRIPSERVMEIARSLNNNLIKIYIS